MPTPNIKVEKHKILRQQFSVIESVFAEEGRSQDFARMLRKIDVEPGNWAEDISPLSRAQYASMLYQLSDTKDIPDLGVKLGRKKGPSAYGIIGVGMVTGLTFAQALKLACWMVHIIWSPLASLTVEHGQDGDYHWVSGRLHVSPTLPREMAENLMDEAMVSGGRLTLESLPGVDPALCEIRLSHPPPEHADAFRETCPCPCSFGQPFTEVRHPAAWVDLPAPFANEAVTRYCEDLCRAMAQPGAEGLSLATQVRQALLAADLSVPPRLELVADQLETTPRALREGLAREHSSFREVLVATRLELAQDYLRNTDHSAKEIAYRLGFGYLTSFYRLFGRLVGLTPEQYRARFRQP